jgi:hypothetical protein
MILSPIFLGKTDNELLVFLLMMKIFECLNLKIKLSVLNNCHSNKLLSLYGLQKYHCANSSIVMETLLLQLILRVCQKLNNLCYPFFEIGLVLESVMRKETNKASVNAVCHPINANHCFFAAFICQMRK